MAKQHSNRKQSKMLARFDAGESATSIAKSMGLYATSVVRVLKRNGRVMSDGKGKNHSGWKGGRGIKSGYWTVYAPDHKRAMNIRRVFEHILVAEEKYGRPINKPEVIHHINLNRLDNDPNNLHLFTNNREHQLTHAQLDALVGQLIEAGVIKFDNGEYIL